MSIVKNKIDLLVELFEKWSNQAVTQVTALPPSGSYREYYRIKSDNISVLGVFNSDKRENDAYLGFTDLLLNEKLNVPQTYIVDKEHDIYLIEDLGDITLFALLEQERTSKEFPSSIIPIYKKVLQHLIQIQVKGATAIDYSLCYPRAAFDHQSMMWDLNYFKYHFLKLGRIPFDEQRLEDDFNRFIEYLLSEEHDFFLYRDFQSRNIMVVNDEPWFIDYQGGRKGALQYDVASLLYDAKADMPNHIREELLNFYIDELEKVRAINKEQFKNYYQGYALIRMLQAMGAYGFRGFFEKKEHFLKSIPFALDNLGELLPKLSFLNTMPELQKTLKLVASSSELRALGAESDNLKVTICSFSYKRGIPVDYSGNGGGFVFDCRAIHNPGKYPEYKTKTGRDAEVIHFFEQEVEMSSFLSDVFSIVSKSVAKYIKSGFTHLSVNFGCTGGQHRSVYSAEQLAAFLRQNYKIEIVIKHVELEMKQN